MSPRSRPLHRCHVGYRSSSASSSAMHCTLQGGRCSAPSAYMVAHYAVHLTASACATSHHLASAPWFGRYIGRKYTMSGVVGLGSSRQQGGEVTVWLTCLTLCSSTPVASAMTCVAADGSGTLSQLWLDFLCIQTRQHSQRRSHTSQRDTSDNVSPGCLLCDATRPAPCAFDLCCL